jgi:hypothetical protein
MSLITDEEKKQTADVLEDIFEFVSEPIPVVHYQRSENGGEGKWNYRHVVREGGKIDKVFFKDDYSQVFAHSSRTGFDLILLMKLFAKRTQYHKLWELMTSMNNVEENRMIVFDLMNEIEEMLCGQPSHCSDIMNYLNAPFRNNHGNLNYMVAQDVATQNFMHHLRSIRNKTEHRDRTNPLFFPSKNPKEHDAFWNDARRRVVMFALMTFDRFYDELYKTLVSPDDEETISTTDEQRLSELSVKGKEVVGQYILEMHNEMRKRLKDAFMGTGLQDMGDLFQRLPDPLLSVVSCTTDVHQQTCSDGTQLMGDAQTLLADDMEHHVKLVVGSAGSGKSVIFYRMMLRDQPRLTPIYIPLDSKGITFTKPEEMILRMERHIIGNRLLILDTWQLQAAKLRIRQRIEEGSAVFFIDALDAAQQQLPFIRQFIETYPKCQYIIGTQHDSITATLETLSPLNPQRYDVQPLSIRQQRELAAVASLHISGTDHTETLTQAIARATQGSDMPQHPFSLMMLISIFESKDNKTTTVNNLTTLYYEIEKKIRDAKNLEQDERQQLLAQNFLKTFSDNCQTVALLCQTVYDRYQENPNDATQWEEPILENSMVKRDLDDGDGFHQWRTLFEYIEVVSERCEGWNFDDSLSKEQKENFRKRSTELLNTLLTVTLLKQGISPQQKDNSQALPAPNPILVKLAQATATLKLCTPGEKSNLQPTMDACGMVRTSALLYRPQPRYIVHRYILTVMEHYHRFDAKHPITFREHGHQLVALFTAISCSGSPMLIKRLFTPFWMRLWLIQQDDQLPIRQDGSDEKLHGLAFEGSPLPEILINQGSNHVTFIMQLMKQQTTWMELWNLGNTKQESRRIIRDIIIFKMNDREREALYHHLHTMKAAGEDDRIGSFYLNFYGNMAIASMESLSLAHLFETNAEMQGPHIIDHLKSKQSDIKALRLLLTIMEQVREKMNNRFGKMQEDLGHKLVEICHHLLRCGIANMTEEGLSQSFWMFIKKLIDDRRSLLANNPDSDQPDWPTEIIDLCPVEDIAPYIAEEIYDMPVFNFLQSVKKNERKVLNKWVEPKKEASNRGLYRKVTQYHTTHRPRRSIQYAFYCQPNASCFQVATECINEMPEGRFCRINEWPDQWFHVEDVQILKTEHPIEKEGIAELTINLPVGASRKQRGTLSLTIPNADNTSLMPLTVTYLHLFSMGDLQQVVIRTEDQEAIAQLKRPEVVKHLKLNRQILWDGQPAMLSGIDCRPINEHMRIIEMRPITGTRPLKFKNIPDIPHRGTLSFYSYTGNDKGNRPLLLATTGPYTQGATISLAASNRMDSIVYLGTDQRSGHKFIAIDERNKLNEGNVLLWDNASWAFSQVVSVYDTTGGNRPTEVTKPIWNIFDQLTKKIRHEIIIDNKKRDKNDNRWVPNFVQIAELENINQQQTPYVSTPSVIEHGADVAFYLPVADPDRAAWKQQVESIVVNGVLAQARMSDEEYTLAVPAGVDYPKGQCYYAANNYPYRLLVEWYEPKLTNSRDASRYRYLKLDERFIQLWEENHSIYFYTDLKQQEPVTLQLPSLLADVDMMNSKRYHADIIPLLETEMAMNTDDTLKEMWQEFCRQKKHQQLNT